MNTDQKERMRNRILSINIAPASCISNEAVLRATNYYSKNDLVTGVFGATSKAAPALRTAGGITGAMCFRSTYNVTFLDSCRPVSEGIDHSILYDTQQGAMFQVFRRFEKDYGFYKKTR